MKSDPDNSVGNVRAVRRMVDSLINESLPLHDSSPRNITIRFSAASSLTPAGTEAVIAAPSTPPFCTPCAPIPLARATQRDSR
jgi:hypothetical protein